MDVDEYIRQIKIFREQAEQYDDDAPGALMTKIRLLTDAHMLMGRVAAQKEGNYARIHVLRDDVEAEARATAKRGEKEITASRASADLRIAEAEALEQREIWKNEYRSLREEIYGLRLKMRLDLQVMGGDVHG
ncbi:hypothetical protein N6H13_25870 [Paenibacillus sp. CC-CFT742]|nr:hypothetical protein [Paenibacillus sp. CC-CFT742]WJH28423.1 hypothetical protein N6H13_25870 [Paenibacillus sp. CC-CFT742]